MFKPLIQRSLEHLLATRWMRDALWRHGRDLFAVPRQAAPGAQPAYHVPPARYALGNASTDTASPLFVTARFRSGSTLLWNLFRNLPGHTAYYEPFNENAWFRDGDRRSTDTTHLGVDDYAAEYRGLGELEHSFDPEWGFRRLYMDEASFDPRMQRYVTTLVTRARGRAVLQFNRADFRLRWLRTHFPRARILHLYRCPRDQWVSILRSDPPPGRDATLAGFEPHDRFYLLDWLRDLATVFPCLDLPGDWHPYAAHYLLWRLSWLHAREHADASIAYEALIEDLPGTFAALAGPLALGPVDTAPLAGLIRGDTQPRWPRYADADWFAGIEAECETLLASTLSTAVPRTPLTRD